MNTLSFDKPVHLTVGLGVLATVDSVEQAHALLNDCPSWQRKHEHEVALNACKAALVGDIDVQTARSTLAAFASRLEGGAVAKPHSATSRAFTPTAETLGAY